MTTLHAIYNELFELYGPQGWWPLGKGSRYHPGNYALPRTSSERFEVYLGAILTQNSTWSGAAAALDALRERMPRSLSPAALLALPIEDISAALRPARYFRQKAKYLREIAEFFANQKGRVPSREALLAVRGVGRETADTILLYAHRQPAFVVDAYTRRVFSARGILNGNEEYDEIQRIFEQALPRDPALYNEYHALLVRHAREYYRLKPYGVGDPLCGVHSEK